MSTAPLIAAIVATAFASSVLAQSIEQEAAKNGFQLLPPAVNKAGEAKNAVRPLPAYVKVVDPRRKVSVLDTQMIKDQPSTGYSIVTFDVDCGKAALRYASAQPLDPPWNPKGPLVTMPRVPWHTPSHDTVPARTLSFACKP